MTLAVVKSGHRQVDCEGLACSWLAMCREKNGDEDTTQRIRGVLTSKRCTYRNAMYVHWRKHPGRLSL